MFIYPMWSMHWKKNAPHNKNVDLKTGSILREKWLRWWNDHITEKRTQNKSFIENNPNYSKEMNEYRETHSSIETMSPSPTKPCTFLTRTMSHRTWIRVVNQIFLKINYKIRCIWMFVNSFFVVWKSRILPRRNC